MGEFLLRVVLLRAILLAGAAAAPWSALAADYPTRPVRVIVGLSAGSGVDVLARAVGQKLSEAMGQPFVIENRPGAGSNIATRMATAAPADGYTVFVATVANAINASLYQNLPFDALRDLEPVILAGTASNILVVNPAVQAKSVPELIDLAKAQPGKFTIGSSGMGTVPQMAAEMFRRGADINIIHVPYKGGPEATTDLLGGQIDLLFAITSTVLPHIQAGRLRPLAIASPARSPLLPEVPTVSESGLPGFEAETWFGFTVPTGTPRGVVERLNGEIGKILAMPEIKQQLAKQGIDVGGGTVDAFGAYMRKEFDKWARVVKASGASIDERM
jgi:tripartite-type tricarboxylate transporter receptor subunit TctC